MTEIKHETWLPADDTEPHACDVCGAKLSPGDWLTREGCCYCDRDEVLM